MKKSYLISALLLLLASHLSAKDGLYVEFNLSSSMANGTIKTYYMDGNTRNEMNMETQMTPGKMVITTLVLKSNPGTIYSLNEGNKTYYETTAANGASNEDTYEITVVGKETINKYSCTHVTARNTRTQKTMEMWLSKDVSNYAAYSQLKTKYFGGNSFFSQLKEKGADGYVVRMITNDDRGGQIQLDLVTVGSRPVTDALFSLDGYTKTGAARPSSPTAPSVDTKQLQNMTPEERKKYIDDMKAKYQQH
jgi:Domain of unknown function (DUF4412)